MLEGNQAVEISKLKDDVKTLNDELRSDDQGIEALRTEKADLINQVMSWEVKATTARHSVKEAEL